MYQEAEKTGAEHLLVTAASEREGIRTEEPAVKETDGAQLQGKLGSFVLVYLTRWPKMCHTLNLREEKSWGKGEWKEVGTAANWGVPTNPWGTQEGVSPFPKSEAEGEEEAGRGVWTWFPRSLLSIEDTETSS